MDNQPAGAANQQILTERIYRSLLQEASNTACRAVERLRVLRELFPEALAEEDIKDVERSHERRSVDRRRAARFRRDLLPVSVCPVGPSEDWVQGWMRDFSPFGLTIQFTQPFETGAVLRLRWPDGPRTLLALVEVKHTKPDGTGWTIGCELLTRLVPL